MFTILMYDEKPVRIIHIFDGVASDEDISRLITERGATVTEVEFNPDWPWARRIHLLEQPAILAVERRRE